MSSSQHLITDCDPWQCQVCSSSFNTTELVSTTRARFPILQSISFKRRQTILYVLLTTLDTMFIIMLLTKINIIIRILLFNFVICCMERGVEEVGVKQLMRNKKLWMTDSVTVNVNDSMNEQASVKASMCA